MKKFVEPELRRIELKLTENIAASQGVGHGTVDIFKTIHLPEGSNCEVYIEETWVPTASLTKEYIENNISLLLSCYNYMGFS